LFKTVIDSNRRFPVICHCAIACCRAVRVLLKFGADPNLPDEFSNIDLVAREKGLKSLRGVFHFVTLVLYNEYRIPGVVCV